MVDYPGAPTARDQCLGRRFIEAAAVRTMRVGTLPRFRGFHRMTGYEWLRAYTALARSGLINDDIRACEQAWGTTFLGDEKAIDCIRAAPGYRAYATALRRLLAFPLTVYRVTTAAAYEEWKAGKFYRPVATTARLESAHIVMEVFPEPGPLVLIKGAVSKPEAVVMRGRIEAYEIVIDSGLVTPVEVDVVA
jgi:hypothetical protein